MPDQPYLLPERLDFDSLAKLLAPSVQIALSDQARQRIDHCRRFLDRKIGSKVTWYGINTGFGALCQVRIHDGELEALQANLLRSHACGTGEEVPAEVVRAMLLLKIHSLSLGFSGVRVQVVERLVDFYNRDLVPVVYQQGSLGASGDLAPLAHLSLPLMGEGEVYLQGRRMPAEEALRRLGLSPLTLAAKEGLALINGTQFCQAYGTWCLVQARRLLTTANLCAALSLDAFDGSLAPFHHLLHAVRPHPGQQAVAAQVEHFLQGSQIASVDKPYVQDPYSFRCVPQVHGASADAIGFAEEVFSREMNSVTDNPTLFPQADLILSGGNFHAQPLALALDLLAIALAELGSISERRTFQLLSGQRALPPFLTSKPGTHSGLMIPQYTAASIVSQNKQLCSPASVDSIVSSNGQEDHVSMAANAATRCRRIVENLESILAIEFLTAAEAIRYRSPLQTSPVLRAVLDRYRQHVPFLDDDRYLAPDIESTRHFLRTEVRRLPAES